MEGVALRWKHVCVGGGGEGGGLSRESSAASSDIKG